MTQKVIKLNEKQLTELLGRVIQEQQVKGQYSSDYHPIPEDDPSNNPFWKEMVSNVTGDGCEIIKYIPNKMLDIDAFGNRYTITKGKI